MKKSAIPLALGLIGTLACGYQGSYESTPSPEAPAMAMPGATGPGLTAADLRTRLFAYAHDSMMGRQIGTWGNYRATEYLAAELGRFGVEPAGEDGYYQTLPMYTRAIAEGSRLSLGEAEFELGTDYLPLPPLQGLPVGETGMLDGVPVIYGGRMGDDNLITAEQAAGKLVVLGAGIGPDGNPAFGLAVPLLVGWRDAAGIAMANLEYGPGGLVGFLMQPNSFMADGPPEESQGPLTLFIGQGMAEALMGAPLADLEPGAMGSPLAGSIGFETRPAEAPARNVIGIVRGSDPTLRNEFVAIGAHSDHVGFNGDPQAHDSLRAYLAVVRPGGAESEEREPTAEEAATIAAVLDSLRAERPVERADSIFNGADDDGSGTVTLLELAEAFAAAPAKPARSILFVFHNGEEAGLLGAQYFTDNPTVDRDAIVAALNMDMIGRGAAYDLPNAGPGYVQLIGSRRLSTELGDLVETVNTEENHGLVFDYEFDADGHPQNYYCRSDHAMYARYGIPVVFFSTGSHRDYHQLTDEAQYIDYDKMARIGQFVMSLAERLAGLDHRVVVDGQVMGPDQPCQQ